MVRYVHVPPISLVFLTYPLKINSFLFIETPRAYMYIAIIFIHIYFFTKFGIVIKDTDNDLKAWKIIGYWPNEDLVGNCTAWFQSNWERSQRRIQPLSSPWAGLPFPQFDVHLRYSMIMMMGLSLVYPSVRPSTTHTVVKCVVSYCKLAVIGRMTEDTYLELRQCCCVQHHILKHWTIRTSGVTFLHNFLTHVVPIVMKSFFMLLHQLCFQHECSY